MRILIVGATGFLGANIAKRAAAQDAEIFAGARRESDLLRLERLAPSARACEFDLDMPLDDLTSRLREIRPDAIVNCAAYGVDHRQQDTERAIAVNIGGVARLVEAVSRLDNARLVQIGTAYEYGPSATPIAEDAAYRPVGVYGATKAAASIVALERARAYGAPTCVLRPFAMYGPLEGEHKLVPLLIRSCRTGTPLELTAGEQRRDYVFVDDVADACLAAAKRVVFPDGKAFNLGSGAPISLRTLGESVADVVGKGREHLLWGAKPYRADEVMMTAADTTRADEVLGWTAATPLHEGLRQTLAFEI